ncbi:helix-turn-helix domain-containing protein [Candidatus Poribacteria bacterium]
MGDADYVDQKQSNIAYAIRLTMTNPPRAPPAYIENRIVEELSSPPNSYHVQSTRYGIELGLMAYNQGSAPSILEYAENLKQTLDSVCGDADAVYSVTPMIPFCPENTMTLGEKLVELRKAKKTETGRSYSIRKAASESDISHTYLRMLENDRGEPSSKVVEKIAETLQYNEVVLGCIAKQPTREILNLLSQYPYWIKALSSTTK